MSWALAPMAAVLWALAFSRLRVKDASRAQKLMTATVLLLAATVTLFIPVVSDALSAVAGTPVADASSHLLAMAVETLILLFVREIRGAGVGPLVIVGIALAAAGASTALLVAGVMSEATTYEASAQVYPWSWPWVSYWSITSAFDLWAFSAGARFYWRYPRQAALGSESLGLLLIGVGTTIALFLSMLRAGAVITAVLGQDHIWDGWAAALASVLIAALVVAVVAGLMSKAALSWPARWRAWRAQRRSLADLEPLWHTLTSAVPNITLDQRAVVSLTGTRLSQRDRLYRRVIEINDGLLALAPYTSALLWQQVFDRARTAGQPARQAQVVADAVALEASLARYRAGSPAAQASTHLVTRQPADFSAEVQRLSALAQASSCQPHKAQVTQRPREMEST